MKVVTYEGKPVGHGRRICVVASKYNDGIVEPMLAAALKALRDCDSVEVLRVPGAFEIPTAARARAAARECDAVVALGCVIRGETAHFDYVCDGCVRGLVRVAQDFDLPVALGVLMTDTVAQAAARAATRGAEAAQAALEMLDLDTRVKRGDGTDGA